MERPVDATHSGGGVTPIREYKPVSEMSTVVASGMEKTVARFDRAIERTKKIAKSRLDAMPNFAVGYEGSLEAYNAYQVASEKVEDLNMRRIASLNPGYRWDKQSRSFVRLDEDGRGY